MYTTLKTILCTTIQKEMEKRTKCFVFFFCVSIQAIGFFNKIILIYDVILNFDLFTLLFNEPGPEFNGK